MKIYVRNQQTSLRISLRAARRAAAALLSFLELPHQALGLYFVTESQITALHKQFFNDPTPTDCISFPVDNKHLGEIFVCPETARRYALAHNLDPWEETLLYIAHGILHCAGYDDIEPSKRRAMRKMEKRCMAHIKKLGIQLAP